MTDRSLHSGERQVAPIVAGIRRDHVARYEWARNRIDPGSVVIDAACGIGYGSAILRAGALSVIGVDVSTDAIAYAEVNYPGPRYLVADLNQPRIEWPAADAAVCFETIEHLCDPHALLADFLGAGVQRLFASVPNQDALPYSAKAFPFHHRHYTREEFAALLEESGWRVVEWHGQEGPHSEVEPRNHGRTLIALCVPAGAP
jgi:2-polyprenyl-3-methyl-5-hydroxy-6-metoxy-1,4-benzoquinol methylase